MAANKMKPDTDRNYKPIREKSIIVKYKDDSKKNKEHIKTKLTKEKIKVTNEVSSNKYELLEFSDSENLSEVINVLGQDPNIEAIQPNYELELFSLEGAEHSEFVIGADINIENAWQMTKGSQDVIVGVLDGDIDINHTELINRLYQNPNEIANDGIDNDLNGYIDDVNGWDFANNDNSVYDSSDESHGTAVSGIIAAEENNVGLVGVAPNITLLPLKIANGTKGYVWDAIKAIEYAEMCGATIINCSWGTSKYSPLLEKAIKDSKMCFVCATGNDGDEGLVYPASYDLPNVISVGAVKDASTEATFSNYGDTVDVVAPGVEVYSAKNGNSYGYISGTSAAAPFVTGVAALIKSYKSEITAKEIVDSIISSTNKDEGIKLVNAANAIAGDIVGEDLEEDLKEHEDEYLKLQRLIDEEKISDEYKMQMTFLVEEGFEVSDIFSCYLFAKSFELNIQDIFNKDKSIGDFNFSGFSEEESVAVTELAKTYNVKISALADCMKNGGLTIEELSEKLSKEGGEFNLFAEGSDAEFKANRGQYNYKQMNNESVNLNTGSLTVQSTDLSLPGRNGFDLNIVTRYNSSEANLYETYPGNQCWPDTYNERNNLLGSGWSFAFSSIEKVQKYNDEFYLHLADGSSYNISDGKNERTGEWFINGYKKDQMQLFKQDTSEFSCNGISAQFVLKYDDGRKEYFTGYESPIGFGRLIGMVDRFGNTIEFHYERYVVSSFETYDKSKDYRLSGNKLGYRLNKIVDSLGRVVSFSYKGSEGYRDIIISLEDGSKIVYELERIQGHPSEDYIYTDGYDINIEDSIGDFQLYRKVDLLGQVTIYFYNYADFDDTYGLPPIGYLFNYSCDRARRTSPLEVTGNTKNYYNLLTEIIYPTNASTSYSYGRETGYLFIEGLIDYPVIQSRRDLEYYDEKDGKQYNVKTYIYSRDNYTGYKFNSSSEGYSTTEYVGEDKNLWVTYSFNDDHELVKEEHYKSGTRKPYKTIEYLYDDRVNCIRKVTCTFDEKDSTQFIKAVENFMYGNRSKKLEYYWDTQTKRNSDDWPYRESDPLHKTVYTYSETLPYLLTSKEYMKDENTTIREEYVLTSDSQFVDYMTIFEKVGSGDFIVKAKKSFNYDKYGNVTEELNYLEDDNWSNYITTKYSYDDNVSSRKGQFNGAYLTKKEVLGVKDADGNLVMDSSKNKTGIVSEEYIYNYYGKMTDYKDANGNTTKYTYDKKGRVLTTKLPDNQNSKVAQYDDYDNDVTLTDENGNKTRFDYDGLGNLLYEQVYDAATNSFKNVKQYSYDENCRIDEEKDLAGKAYVDYSYYLDGRLEYKKVMDYSNNNALVYQETYTYDDVADNECSVVTKVVEGETNSPDIVTKTYTNKHGMIEKIERVGSNKTYTDKFKYDFIGNKIEELSARASDEAWTEPYTAKYDYDYAGNIVKQYNVKGDYISTVYDALGRVKSVTDIKGNKASTKYSTIYEYDNLGRVIKETIPFSVSDKGVVYKTIKKHYYDGNGNVICEQITNNKPGETESYSKTEYKYNSRNLLEMVITYDNGVPENYTQYFYDNVGNKKRMYTGLSNPLVISGLDKVSVGSDTKYSTTKYDYNNLNLLSKMTDPLEKSEIYSYDLAGRLMETIDRNGNTTTFIYDALDNIVEKTVRNKDNTVLGRYTYKYYTTGNRAEMSGGGTTVNYIYDDFGRLINETDTLSATEKIYKYDAGNNRKSFTLKKGSASHIITTYEYDKMDRLDLVKENGTTVADYDYDDNGNRLSLKYPVNGNSTDYAYNLANKLETLTNKKGTTPLSQYSYTYYLDGNQASKTDSVSGKSTSYVYDDLGRLEKVTEPDNEWVYSYDDYNNREKMVKSGTSTTSYEYDANNRLRYEYSQDGTTEYIYDNNGNQKTKVALNVSSTYTYDGFNQLIKVEEGKGSYSYTYNGDGLRTSKAINGEKIVHVWDGQQVVAEINGSGNVTDKYIRGINLIYFDNSSTKSYYLFNGHGDVVHLTDTSGTVTKSYDYDAFGNLFTGEADAVMLWGDVTGDGSFNSIDFLVVRQFLLGMIHSFPAEYGLQVADVNGSGDIDSTDFALMRRYLLGMIKYFPVDANSNGYVDSDEINDEDDNPFRYCGEYWDKETATYYLRARYYNPVTGRFITEDSFAGYKDDPLSLNRYTYCSNNPILFVDPSGNTYVIAWSYGRGDVEAYEQYRVKKGFTLTVDSDTSDWDDATWSDFTKRSSFARAAYTRKQELLDMGIPESDIDVQRIDGQADLEATWDMWAGYSIIEGLDFYSHGSQTGPVVYKGTKHRFWENAEKLNYGSTLRNLTFNGKRTTHISSPYVVFYGCNTGEGRTAQVFANNQNVVTYAQIGVSSFSLSPYTRYPEDMIITHYKSLGVYLRSYEKFFMWNTDGLGKASFPQ